MQTVCRPTQFGSVKNIVFEDIRIFYPVVYAIDVLMDSDHLAVESRGPTCSPVNTLHITQYITRTVCIYSV